MNPKLADLHPYPFQKLAQLTKNVPVPSGKQAIMLSVGEPKHPAPSIVLDEIVAQLKGLSSYPTTRGTEALRTAIADWLTHRFLLNKIVLDPDRHVLPACGTREALFSIAQTVINTRQRKRPVVIMPNPFYQIYEGAAILAGAEPYYLNTTSETNYKMDFDSVPAEVLERTQLVYLCTPGNPTGAVMSETELAWIIGLAEKYNFVIASDECYSEIYFDETDKPPGLLQAANNLGIKDYHRCVVFHSLSKRSNLPGLRSGFIAGDGKLMHDYLRYRTYHGCTITSIAQSASIKAWHDETHVYENREAYRAKFDMVLGILQPVLQVPKPQAGFYLWSRTPVDDERFTRELYASEHVMVLPGRYLSREAHGINPGVNHIRMALVASIDECLEAANRIKEFLQTKSLSGDI